LLDWLAIEFRETGWDTKALVRLIVTSHTYRQSSRITPEMHERDAANLLYARGSRYRLPSWMIRDQALAASGLLVGRLGGPPVKPYQPEGVWEETTFGEKKYVQDQGDALYRRSLYTFWRRIIAPTEFFDVHSRMTTSVKPARTNTPMHALTTLNNTTYVEAARALAGRVMREAAGGEQRVQAAYRAVLARPPTAAEGAVFLGQHRRLLARFADDPASAARLLDVGESPRDPTLSSADHAAWTSLCLALFNLDETLNKEEGHESSHREPPSPHPPPVLWALGHRHRRGGAGLAVEQGFARLGGKDGRSRGRPAGPSTLRAQGQTGHLSLHERRAHPRRHV
jgi:hypothetical protein